MDALLQVRHLLPMLFFVRLLQTVELSLIFELFFGFFRDFRVYLYTHHTHTHTRNIQCDTHWHKNTHRERNTLSWTSTDFFGSSQIFSGYKLHEFKQILCFAPQSFHDPWVGVCVCKPRVCGVCDTIKSCVASPKQCVCRPCNVCVSSYVCMYVCVCVCMCVCKCVFVSHVEN